MATPARLVVCLALASNVLAGGSTGRAQTADLDTQLMLATVKILDPHATGTGFVLGRPGPGGKTQSLLVTAEHTLSRTMQEDVTIVYHRHRPDGSYAKAPTHVKIRRAGKPLWIKHPTADVAVLPITPPDDARPPLVEVEQLATDADIARFEIHPGDAIRCVGFPHPNQFESGEAGFAVVRSGCIASYPLLPTRSTKTFIVDLNIFEGDSGAAVYMSEAHRPTAKSETAPARLILGLVIGQHFIDEEYRMVYQTGKFRHRMGLGVTAHASAIRETIDLVPGAAK
jgi:hypothetical protein